MVRVVAYVDGFNLYFGLRARRGRKDLWLDLHALATSLLLPGQVLHDVVYFTARVRDDPDAARRQSCYLDALAAHSPSLTIVDGRFQEKDRRCWRCGSVWSVYEEKETDVNIAVSLVEDAVADRYDTALVVSADSDLCPAVRSVKRLRPDKRVVAAFPPNRQSAELKRATDGHLFIGQEKIRRSQLPTSVTTATGMRLDRPEYWN